MFPLNELYIFTGCIRNVLCNADNRPMDNPIIVYDKKDKNYQLEYVYLGEFLKMENYRWTNGEIIHNGLAMFQYGSIRFPDYQRIQISLLHRTQHPYQQKRVSSNSRSVSWKEDDYIVQFMDIYNDSTTSSVQSVFTVYEASIAAI